MMESFLRTLDGLKPAILMVAYQIATAAVNVLYKLAVNDGMKISILVSYRLIFAAAFIVPLAFVLERGMRPKLTWVVLGQAFLCGLLLGSLGQYLYAESLMLTSVTFVAAMVNIVPAITFILAIFFGLERLALGTLAGKAKVLGTLICISGAMILTFYKGIELNLGSTHIDLLKRHVAGHGYDAHGHDRLLGGFLTVCTCLSAALGVIIQAKMINNYPCKYSSTALIIVMGAIQAVVFALCMERTKWNEWKLGWDIRLLAGSYTGIVGSGILITVFAYVVQKRGPLYASVFTPLALVFVAIAGSFILNEKLHMGSVIGAVVIVCGLYFVLWAKGKELKILTERLSAPLDNPKENEGNVEVTIISSNEEAPR